MSSETGDGPVKPQDGGKFAYDADHSYQTDLQTIAITEANNDEKQKLIEEALIKKRKFQVMNAYNLDVDHEEEGAPDAPMSPVPLDITDEEIEQAENVTGVPIRFNDSLRMNDQVVRGIYAQVGGGEYPDEGTGDTPSPEQLAALPLNRLQTRLDAEALDAGEPAKPIDPAKLKVVNTPAYQPHSFALQRVSVEGSGVKVHTFIKTPRTSTPSPASQ